MHNKFKSLFAKEDTDFFEMLVEKMPTPLFFKDADGKCTYFNKAFEAFIGLEMESLGTGSALQAFDEEGLEVCKAAEAEICREKTKREYENKMRCKDGSVHDVILNEAPITDEKGQVMGFVGTLFDVTDNKQAEMRINKLLKMKEAILRVNHAVLEAEDIDDFFNIILKQVYESVEHADMGSILLVGDGGLLEMAAGIGYDKERASQFKLTLEQSFFYNESKGKMDRPVIINNIKDKVSVKIPGLMKNEGNLAIESSLSAPIMVDGKLCGLVNIDCIYNNVYDEEDIEVMDYMSKQIAGAVGKHKLYEEIKRLSRYDKLTNVYNRSYFEELFEVCLAKAERYEERFSLVMFDLNNLKQVNDSYGHLTGDALIKGFADRLGGVIRSSDILARVGGDEFITVFIEISLEDLVEKLESLHDDLKRHRIRFENMELDCSFSYGIARYPADGRDYNELMKVADKKMYEYKQLVKGFACGEKIG